ncbi:MAG: ATP synthase F1 subunit delta [Bacteroidales bacterium]
MNDSKISVRYARALFQSALEKNIQDQVRKDMEEVQATCLLPDFQYLLLTPVIKDSEKREIMNNLFGKRVHALTLSLLTLLIRNGREQFVPGIARNFIAQYKKHHKIKTAIFTSASSVPEATRMRVKKVIEETLNSPVELEGIDNAALIGGFVIRIDDLQYDASVASSLNKLKKQLLN